MKRNFNFRFAALALLLVLFCSSCTDEEYDFEDFSADGLNIHTSMAAPLLKSHSTFADIFDMESIKGFLHPVDGEPINLADASLGEIKELLKDPMKLMDVTKFNSSVVIDDINFDEIFGEGNSISNLDSMVLIFDVVTNIPFEINLQMDFVTGINPTEHSPRIENLHNAIVVPACVAGKEKVSTTQYIRYGNICDEIANATGMVFNLSFGIPEGTKDAAISIDQYVDLKIKAYVEGDINPSDL